MSVFAAALATLHADVNLGEEASYLQGAGDAVALRIIRSQPNDVIGGAGIGARAGAVHASVTVAALGGIMPRRGDRLTLGAVTYTVDDIQADVLGLSFDLTLARLTTNRGFTIGESAIGGADPIG